MSTSKFCLAVALLTLFLIGTTLRTTVDAFVTTLSSSPTSAFTGIEQRRRFQRRRQGYAAIIPLKTTTTDNNDNKNDTPSIDTAPKLTESKPRNVLLMVEPTPFTHVSGYANRFKEMLRFLSKAGDKVNILTVDEFTSKGKLPKESFGYPIEHTQGFTFPLYNQISLSIDLPDMKSGKVINDLIAQKDKPDLIHVTSPGFMLFPAMVASWWHKIPLLMSYHTHLPSYGKNYLGFIPKVEQFCWALLRLVHNSAALTLVTSPQMKDELTSNGIKRVDVWRKGIDTIRFHPKFKSQEMRKKMTDNNPNDFLMVYVGRLGAEKRIKDVKDMMEQMPNGGKGVRLCIVGKGPQEEELHKHFEGTNTVFTGQLGGDELSSAFASADVFIMPSDSETLGFVVLESMASGVPVIGAKAGGIPDLIKDNYDGFLVEPGDTKTYVDRLTLLKENQDNIRHEIGIRARTEAEKWGWEAATSVLRNLQYEKAIINFDSQREQLGMSSNKSYLWSALSRNASATKAIFKALRNRLIQLLVSIGLLKSKGSNDNEKSLLPEQA